MYDTSRVKNRRAYQLRKWTSCVNLTCEVTKVDIDMCSPRHGPTVNLYLTFPCNLVHYTQSQKKRTMNSLASLVTQGQGQVTPVRSHLITHI